MKIRNGFVSNSSSSSFVCSICGEQCSGMDMVLSEAEMTECENGHTFCDSHALEAAELTIEEKRAKLLKDAEDDATKEAYTNADEDEINDYYEDNYDEDDRYDVPIEKCPCCMFVSPTDTQLLQFFLLDNNMSRKELTKNLKAKFKDGSELIEAAKKIKK